MNVVVLMSGTSQSFKDAGYVYPKNLAEISGQPMLQHVMRPLLTLKTLGAKYISILLRDENRKLHTGKVLQLMDPEITYVEVHAGISGAACSALLAIDQINNDEPLIVCNGDQILSGVDLPGIVSGFRERLLDAGVIVFEDIHPRWSFVKCNPEGAVVEAAEKRPISKFATAGFFYFQRGKDFVSAAMEMIKKDAQVNGLYYICPVLNEMILKQANIGIHQIDRSCYISLSSPNDVHAYTATYQS